MKNFGDFECEGNSDPIFIAVFVHVVYRMCMDTIFVTKPDSIMLCFG